MRVALPLLWARGGQRGRPPALPGFSTLPASALSSLAVPTGLPALSALPASALSRLSALPRPPAPFGLAALSALAALADPLRRGGLLLLRRVGLVRVQVGRQPVASGRRVGAGRGSGQCIMTSSVVPCVPVARGWVGWKGPWKAQLRRLQACGQGEGGKGGGAGLRLLVQWY